MALIHCDFFAETLELGTSMTVVLPQTSGGQVGLSGAGGTGAPPVLYLLHGLTDDDTAWTRYTSIERYATARGLAVVMPQVHRSFYADEVHGMRFWTFLSEELPAVVADFFRVSQRREDTFVAGLSMGGYGALKWALNQPERFAAAASLSGALDAAALVSRPRPEDPRMGERIFGDADPAGGPADLVHLVTTADREALPALRVACGTEDELLDGNRAFLAACDRAGVPVTTDLGPGTHEWGYWDAQVQEVLRWLPLDAAPAR
jgi:S-formylglutathione hydrolase FrmB